MKGLTITCLFCVVIIFIAAALICHIIALATHYWLRSSSSELTNFLNIGLWVACFDNYIHPHEDPKVTYDGCDHIDSDTYRNIQDWLKPGKYTGTLQTNILHKTETKICDYVMNS